MIDCRSLVEAHASYLTENLLCRPYQEGSVIVTTPYLLPDGDLIELVVEPRGDHVRVRDLGQTMGILIAQGFDPDASDKRQWLAEQATRLTGVKLEAGELRKEGPPGSVGELLLDVALAARGVADLIYLHRSQEPQDFEARVRTFLEDQALRVDPKAKIRGESGREYTLTARVHRETTTPLLVTALSPRTAGQIKSAVDRTVRLWVDINGQVDRSGKLSFVNDAMVTWPSADLRLLNKLSLVVGWRSRQRLVPVLAGDVTNGLLDETVPLWDEETPEDGE